MRSTPSFARLLLEQAYDLLLQGLALRYSVQSSAILRANRLGSAAALHGLKEIIIPPKARSPSLEKVAYQI